MIPAAAVEAALEAYVAAIDADRGDYKDDMRAALEAAAPHMLAEAKASALEEMATDVSLRIDQIEAHQVPECEYGTLLAQREEACGIYRDILAKAATYRPTP